MSEVRICDACRFKSYASEPGAPTQTTVEYETDDGDILSAEWVLCSGCAGKLTGARGPPVCPFCLERAAEKDPKECPEQPAAGVNS